MRRGARFVAVVAAVLLPRVSSAASSAPAAAFVFADLLPPLTALGETPVATVACVGARGTGKSTMMRSMFGPAAVGQGVAQLEAESGCDYDKESGGFRVGARDTSVALALADVLIFNVLSQDLAREGAASLDSLQPAIEELLARYADGKIGDSRKKTLVIAVRDFDGGAEEQAHVKSTVSGALEAAWARVVKPRAYRDAPLSDVLEVSVSFLPHYSFASDAYKNSVVKLRQSVLEAAATDGEEASQTPAAEVVRRLKALTAVTGVSIEAPAEKELRGAYAGEAAAAAAMAELRVRAKALDAASAATAGKFGTLCDEVLEAAMSAFDAAAGDAAGTTAGARKRAAVRAAALRELEARYRMQLGALVTSSLARFAKTLTGLRGSAALAKELGEAVAESDRSFVAAAKALKPKAAAWGYESARKTLRDQVREMASERLQMVKLQGGPGAAGRTRRPVAVSFHWLLPKPFGTDARHSVLTVDDVLRFSGTEPSADTMFFEFAPLDSVQAPGAQKESEPAGWEGVRQRAERMVYRKR